MYMIHVRPYEDPIINRLETFNEIIILVCCYHLLFFIDGNIEIKMKFMAGWSLDLLILVQFLFNSYI